MKKFIAGISLDAAALVGIAGLASAHGDRPDAVCAGPQGVSGATRGVYGAGTPWVSFPGGLVPLTYNGHALTGVGGDGWDSPFGQVPECDVPESSTTTSPAEGTTTTTSAVTTTTERQDHESTTTTTTVTRVGTGISAVPSPDPLACIAPDCVATQYWDGKSFQPLVVELPHTL